MFSTVQLIGRCSNESLLGRFKMNEFYSQLSSRHDGDWSLVLRQIMENCGQLGRMWIGYLGDRALHVLVPSWGEINVTLATAVVLVLLVSFLQTLLGGGNQSEKEASRKRMASAKFDADGTNSGSSSGNSGTNQSKEISGGDSGSNFVYMIKMELLAAKNLVAANLNGTSDPYAIIVCGEQKRFSSMVQGSRNPMWGEEFYFYTEDLPVEIDVSIYDWDIVWKSACLGSTTLLIDHEGSTEAVWHALNSPSGQVCLQAVTTVVPSNSEGSLNAFAGAMARRRFAVEKPIGTEVRQKPGPLQTIFNLPPDEVVINSYSCALERSFLYHGRMFVSAWHICFHSNVFAKSMKVVLPYEDIEEIKRSQHAFINPAITLILRAGSGGHGVPPLASTDGRAKYKFASFWNRNHAQRALLKAAKNFQTMQEAAKLEKKASLLRTQSRTFGSSKDTLEAMAADAELSEAVPVVEAKTIEPFLQEDVLVDLMQVDLPGTAEEVWRLCFHGSKFTEEMRSARRDTELKIDAWNSAEEYHGDVREITFRAVCSNPMCPPDTAMTEYQHAHLSEDKQSLLFETVQQCHDVPFGSYFEVHVKWMFETTSQQSCHLSVKVGAHFKKWCMMQSKIKSGTVKEYKGDAELIISTVRKFLEDNRKAREEINESIESLETEIAEDTPGVQIKQKVPNGSVTTSS